MRDQKIRKTRVTGSCEANSVLFYSIVYNALITFIRYYKAFIHFVVEV